MTTVQRSAAPDLFPNTDDNRRTTSGVVFLFPGQGAYVPGVLGSLADDQPAVAELLTRIDRVADLHGRNSIMSLLLDPAAPSLSNLVETSPSDLHFALIAAQLALFELLTEHCGLYPDFLLGHSFGEICALAAAGVYTLEDSLALVAARDKAFTAYPMPAGGMLALGLSASRTQSLLDALGEWEVCVAACNSPEQTVVSGPDEPLRRLHKAAEAVGIDAVRLRAPYPFHNRMLAPAARDVSHQASALRQFPARHRVYSAILGRFLDSPDDTTDLVGAHLVRPTHFVDAVRVLFDMGVRTFVECGPRRVLSDLVTATVPDVTVVAPLQRRGAQLADLDRELAALGYSVTRRRGGVAPATGAPATGAAGPSPSPSTTAGRTFASTSMPLVWEQATPGPLTEADPAEVPNSDPGPSRPAPDAPDRMAMLDALRTMFAAALEYPPDVLTEDAALEADLGIDSLKQNDLLAQARRRYGVGEAAAAAGVGGYATLGELADLLIADGAK